MCREHKLENILENFVNLSDKQQISKAVETAFQIGSIDKFVSLTHTLNISNILSTSTTEAELDQTIFGQNSEFSISSDYLSSEDSASSDSDSE